MFTTSYEKSRFCRLVLGYDALLFGVWKILHFSPKRCSVLERDRPFSPYTKFSEKEKHF